VDSRLLTKPSHELAEASALRVSQDEGMRECIGKGANADLQRTAIFDQRRSMQRHSVVSRRYRLLWWREQLEVRCSWFEQAIEGTGETAGCTTQEGQVGIPPADNRHWRTAPTTLMDVAIEVQRNIGVGGQAEAGLAVLPDIRTGRRNELCEDINTLAHE